MYALSCLNQFVDDQDMGTYPERFLQPFLHALFALTDDPDDRVRKNVVQALVSIYESHPDLVAGNIEGVIQFMVGFVVCFSVGFA